MGLRLLLGALFAPLGLWFTIVVSTAGIFRDTLPEAALRFAPFDARAQARVAQRALVRAPAPDALAHAEQRALAAMRRDATAIQAVATLGFVFALRHQPERAEQSFRYAERLSRRDVPTQLWLIELNVQRDNSRGALAHFDTVLRTAPSMHPMLMPILANASADPAIASELNRLLRNKPIWNDSFYPVLWVGQPDPGALYNVTRGLLSADDPREREHLERLLTRLTELEAYDLAWRAYVARRPVRRSGAPVPWNGDFANDPGLPPFDWSFTDDPSLSPERRPRGSEGAYFLSLPTGATREVEAARQLLRLTPGRYEVVAEVGNVSEGAALRPALSLYCTGQPRRELIMVAFPPASGEAAGLSAPFTIPAGCSYQWIAINVPGTFDEQISDPAWISSIRIRRL